jgi:hypothetical protein
MKYLVIGSEGPGFASPEQAVEILEKVILPTFDAGCRRRNQEKTSVNTIGPSCPYSGSHAVLLPPNGSQSGRLRA